MLITCNTSPRALVLCLSKAIKEPYRVETNISTTLAPILDCSTVHRYTSLSSQINSLQIKQTASQVFAMQVSFPPPEPST